VGDRVIGNEKKASFHGRKGAIVQYESRSQYWVMFNDGLKECVNSCWLDDIYASRPSSTHVDDENL
jgi:hypothetical protein